MRKILKNILLFGAILFLFGTMFRDPHILSIVRLCCGLTFAVLSGIGIIVNLIFFIQGMMGFRTSSLIPFVGGILGFLAIGILPDPSLWPLCWIPIVLDVSVLAFVCSLPLIISDTFFVSYSIKIEDGLLLFMRKGEFFQKISVSEICRCERVRGRIKVWYGEQPYYGICSFSTRWENAVEVYMMLEKIVASKMVTNVA